MGSIAVFVVTVGDSICVGLLSVVSVYTGASPTVCIGHTLSSTCPIAHQSPAAMSSAAIRDLLPDSAGSQSTCIDYDFWKGCTCLTNLRGARWRKLLFGRGDRQLHRGSVD